MYTYPIDYEQFSTEEIITIIEFLSLIEEANKKPINPIVLSAKYNGYRTIINSVSMEKQIDRDFEKLSGCSIHKTIKRYK